MAKLALTRLLQRGDDTDFALGSDAMAVATRACSLVKMVSDREGRTESPRDLGSRFSRSRRVSPEAKKAA